MKPGGIESLRGLQAALADSIIPELQAMYAQDVAQTIAMLIESIAADWDTAADDLKTGNAAVRGLLREAFSVFSRLEAGNEQAGTLVKQVEEAVALPPAASLRISELTSESEQLRATLERVLVALEDIAAGPEDHPAMALRESIYSHLRIGAAAGWSFWDVASFRERMARLKSEQ